MNSLETKPATSSTTAARLRLTLVRLARALRREGQSRLTASQVSALATVEEMGPLRISALATLESMDPSVATRVVAGLETQGLLERRDDPDDKRACLVDLSPRGHVELSDLWHERTVRLGARLERLSEKERRAIDAALPVLEKLARET